MSSPVIWVLYFINIVTVIALIFFEKKNPTSILLWSIILLLFPFVGLVLYVLFGKGASFGKKKKFLNKYTEDEKYKKLINSQIDLIGGSDFSDNIKELIRFNLSSGSLCSADNEAVIYTRVANFYDDIFIEIDKAKSFVNVQYYIIRSDEIGKKLIKLLAKKAQEGIKVRLLYDDLGCMFVNKSFFKELKDSGGEVYSFFPSFFKLINRNINYRNHRKMIIIDGYTAYIGGSNIGGEYLGKNKITNPWTDCNIKFKGTAAMHLNIRFLQDFNFACKKIAEPIPAIVQSGNKNILPVQILSDGPDTIEGSIEQAYIKAIYNAKKKVYIQTPYLILDRAFLLALVTAVKSGIDVKVMLPSVPDKKIVYYATLSYAADLIKEGVKVYAREGFLHSKTLVVDDEICSIGSFNIDIRSFFLQFEITAFIYDKKTVSEMCAVFENDMQKCTELDNNYLINRPISQKFKEKITRLFTPIM